MAKYKSYIKRPLVKVSTPICHILIDIKHLGLGLELWVFNITFNNISVTFGHHGGQLYWWCKLEYLEENHQSAASHWQIFIMYTKLNIDIFIMIT